MGRDIDVSAVLGLLGQRGQNPLAARRHRGTLATRHAINDRTHWAWRAQSAAAREATVGIVFANVSLGATRDGVVAQAGVGEAVLLHPYLATEVTGSEGGVATCLWLPWDAVSEVEDGVQVPGHVLAQTPLTAGLRAFLATLLDAPAEPTPYTDYLMERLLAEMAFGVVLESVPMNVSAARPDRMIDRARSIMLLRRGEPEFGVSALAQEMHLSTRHVQRLFAAENSAPADELRSMRVELALEMLGDPSYDALSVGDIAVHSGFVTSAALRRAFAKRGMPLPARVRQRRATSA